MPHDVQLAGQRSEGLIEQASSGQAADGMSVAGAGHRPQRRSTDARGHLDRDPARRAGHARGPSDGDRVLLRFGQEAPPEHSDLMAADRIVV